MIEANELKEKLSIFNMNLDVEANDLPINVQTKVCKAEFQSEDKGAFNVEVLKDGEWIGEIAMRFGVRKNKFKLSVTARIFANDPYYDHIVDTFDKILKTRVWADLEV